MTLDETFNLAESLFPHQQNGKIQRSKHMNVGRKNEMMNVQHLKLLIDVSKNLINGSYYVLQGTVSSTNFNLLSTSTKNTNLSVGGHSTYSLPPSFFSFPSF